MNCLKYWVQNQAQMTELYVVEMRMFALMGGVTILDKGGNEFIRGSLRIRVIRQKIEEKGMDRVIIKRRRRLETKTRSNILNQEKRLKVKSKKYKGKDGDKAFKKFRSERVEGRDIRYDLT